MFETIENKSMSQKIVDQIQEMIMNGELTQGSLLPSERELAETLGVGRPTLREALKSLEVMGIISSRQGSGNMIVNNVNEKFTVPMTLSFKLSGGDPQEILEFRQMVEYYTVDKAASIASPEDIEELRAIEKEFEDADDQKKRSAADRKFHQKIADICGNSLVLDTLENAGYLLDTFSEETISIATLEGDSLEKIYDEHSRIIDALNSHDSLAALDAMKEHLRMIDVTKIK